MRMVSGTLVVPSQKPCRRVMITKGWVVGGPCRRRSLGCMNVRLQHAGLRKADRQQNSLYASATAIDSQIFLPWLIETRQSQTHDTIYKDKLHGSANLYDTKVRG
jgi:hypothetical protein